MQMTKILHLDYSYISVTVCVVWLQNSSISLLVTVLSTVLILVLIPSSEGGLRWIFILNNSTLSRESLRRIAMASGLSLLAIHGGQEQLPLQRKWKVTADEECKLMRFIFFDAECFDIDWMDLITKNGKEKIEEVVPCILLTNRSNSMKLCLSIRIGLSLRYVKDDKCLPSGLVKGLELSNILLYPTRLWHKRAFSLETGMQTSHAAFSTWKERM